MDEGSDLEEGNLIADHASSAPVPITPAPPVAAMPPMPEHVVVRKDYDPKLTHHASAAAAAGGQAGAPGGGMATGGDAAGHYLISPLTGERIRADLMTEHMRIGLLLLL